MPPKQKASSLNPLPVNPLSSSRMLWASDQTKVQIPRWNVSGQTEIGKLGSPEMVYREFMNSERGPMKTIDLSNYYWAGEEAKVREEEQNRIKRLYDYGAKLLKLIKNSLPEIPNDKIENMEAQQQFVEEILKKNNLWDGQMTLLQKAFQSDIHIDKFIDFMIELWPEPTASKLIYLLHILTNNDCVKTNIRRRHIIRICNFIMHEESFENVCNFSLQKFLFSHLELSWNVLETLLMDELRKSKRKLSAKEKKKQGAQYLFEIRCIEFLSTFCQKTGQESYMKSLVQIYKEVLTTCEDEYLHSIIILDLKEMKVNSKSTFKIVEKVYENGSVLEEVAGTFYQFCKATETEEFVTKPHLLGKDSKEEYKKKRNLEHERRLNILRVVRQGTEMPVGKYPSTKNEFAINSEIYSISDLKQKLQNSLPAIEPKNRWASLEKVHGDKFEEIQKQELIRFVSLVNRFNILSLRHTRPLSQHHKTHEIMKIDDVKEHIRETLTEYCAKTDFVEFIQPDIQVFIDYIQNDNSLRLDDALFFLAQCNEENIMIVEKFSHQTFSMKPVYTFLIDQDGFISRIQQLLFDHVVGLGTETPVEKEMRLQVAHDCIYLIQQMFLAMTRHSEVARIKYLLTETKLIESMIHCWMHAKDELMICEGFSQCFEDIIESSEIVPMNLVFKKQFLALLIDMLSVAKTLPDREEDKPDFTTLTRSVSSLLYRVSIPTEINAATGIFPKKQRKLLSAIEECTILDDLLAVMEQKKYLIEELFSWKLSQERKYYHDWIPSLATLFSNCSRQPSLREYFYKDNFKYSEFILKEIVFPLSDTLSGFGAKNLPAANTPVCYGFINYLSIINHLLFDPEQRERFFSDPVNRTSKKGQKLEDMCFYWMVEMLKLFKDSRTELTQAQQFIWGRTSFCVCSMVLHDSFRKYLVRDTNFVEMLMDFLKSRTSHLFKDIKNACCRILQAILRDEEVKNKLNVNALLKFIDSEMSFALESPFSNRMPPQLVTGLFYDLIGSQFGEEAETLVKSKYPLLKIALKDAKKPLPKCSCCGKESTHNSETLKRCGGCREAKYCSVECQRKDWPRHKLECGKQDEIVVTTETTSANKSTKSKKK